MLQFVPTPGASQDPTREPPFFVLEHGDPGSPIPGCYHSFCPPGDGRESHPIHPRWETGASLGHTPTPSKGLEVAGVTSRPSINSFAPPAKAGSPIPFVAWGSHPHAIIFPPRGMGVPPHAMRALMVVQESHPTTVILGGCRITSHPCPGTMRVAGLTSSHAAAIRPQLVSSVVPDDVSVPSRLSSPYAISKSSADIPGQHIRHTLL